MAFTVGVHIECGFGGSRSHGTTSPIANFAVEGELVWSQTMTVAGTTSLVAPPFNSIQGDPLICIDSVADIFVAIGPNPDANVDPRMLVRAGVPRQRYVKSGDRLAWVPA